MTDTNRPQVSTSEDILSRLPYRLSEGVTATREGLEFNRNKADLCLPTPWSLAMRISWPDAAKRLRYRKGEPWCYWHDQTDSGDAVIELASHPDCRELLPTLHRLAAILCDDAEGFRVLHWCVTNLGGRG